MHIMKSNSNFEIREVMVESNLKDLDFIAREYT